MKTNHKHTILVVDDSKAIVSLNVGLLSDEFTVATAYSGEEAIELFMKIKPTVILLDVEMPGIDGIEVCRRIQKLDDGLYTPIIFVTSRGDSNTIAEALNAGGEGYMTKPYSAQELKARIHAAIRTKTLMNELQHANAIIEKERDSIAKIQRSLLPKDLPHLTGYNFFSDYKPSSKAGGIIMIL